MMRISSTSRLWLTPWVVLAGFAIAPPREAVACNLCLRFPARTAADQILEANCVLLARTDESQPFVYAPQEVLKGAFDGEAIGLLVDSVTRRRLAADSNCRVVLVQATAGGPWQSLGIASHRYECVVRRIVLFSTAGNSVAGDEDRLRFFLSLFGDADHQTRELAYLELGRAPYQVICQLGRSVPRSSFAEMLKADRYFEWRALAILLLAQSEAVEDRQFIRDSFELKQRLGLVRHLSAWAVALIQIDGVAGIDLIESLYWHRADRRLEEMQEISRAMVLHATEGVDAEVRAAAEKLLRQRPELVPSDAASFLHGERRQAKRFLSPVQRRSRLAWQQAEVAGLDD